MSSASRPRSPATLARLVPDAPRSARRGSSGRASAPVIASAATDAPSQRRDRRRTVLEQLAVGEDLVARRRRGPACATRHRRAGRRRAPCAPGSRGPRDRRDAVVRPRGQVDDRAVGADQRRVKLRRGPRADRLGHRPPRRRAARRSAQMRSSARTTTRGRLTRQLDRRPRGAEHVARRDDAAGRPPSTIGMWRKPPTAILWIATATCRRRGARPGRAS